MVRISVFIFISGQFLPVRRWKRTTGCTHLNLCRFPVLYGSQATRATMCKWLPESPSVPPQGKLIDKFRQRQPGSHGGKVAPYASGSCPDSSITTEAFGGINAHGFGRLDRHGKQGDQKSNKSGAREQPPYQIGFESKAVQPFCSNIVAYW